MTLDLKLCAGFFKLFADPARLRMIRLLHGRPDGLCGCEISSAMKMPQYTVSRHLQALKDAGLLSSKRTGTWVYYSVKENRLPDAFLMLVLQNLKDNRLDEDRHRLEERLILRENDRCFVGFVSEKELKRRIREKKACC